MCKIKIAPKKFTNKVPEEKFTTNNTPLSDTNKARALYCIQKKKKYHYFIETGTYLGDTTAYLIPYFKELHTIELSKNLARRAQLRFQNQPKITVHQGDSGKVLPKIMPQIKSAALFWLDGHYCHGISAKGKKKCPIYEELSAIFSAERLSHTLLIDDMRLFVGQNDYPTLSALSAFIKKARPEAHIHVKDDIMQVQL